MRVFAALDEQGDSLFFVVTFFVVTKRSSQLPVLVGSLSAGIHELCSGTWNLERVDMSVCDLLFPSL